MMLAFFLLCSFVTWYGTRVWFELAEYFGPNPTISATVPKPKDNTKLQEEHVRARTHTHTCSIDRVSSICDLTYPDNEIIH
jgi:hypothetical protein